MFTNQLFRLGNSVRRIQKTICENPRCRNFSTTNVKNLSKSIEEKVGLPPRPKRPLTPYFRFMKQVRSNVVQENPKATAIDITKLIAQKWEKVDIKEKLKFEEEYKKDQEKYIEEKLKYDSKLTAEDRQKLTNVRREIDSKRKRKAKRNKCKEFKKPKKNPSAFVLWMLEQYPERGSEPFRTFQLRVAQQWKSMSDSERKPYADRAKEMNEKYKEELTQWEEKMIRLGNIDIVRNDSKVLKIPSKTNRQRTKTKTTHEATQ
ncbi:high mobility group B protein 13 [Chrysoperla carnea]|uniref:high mobility group B protein 13 n=1 Tax=Chrysoperla carnea TaxID=189513 RepID=UPI001D098492|nr:high mobility group B protein 13 [Chrysoperla carnea]